MTACLKKRINGWGGGAKRDNCTIETSAFQLQLKANKLSFTKKQKSIKKEEDSLLIFLIYLATGQSL